MRTIVVVTPADARLGFALGGVHQVTSDPAGLDTCLRGLMADPDTGVVVVDERLVPGPAQQRLRELERRWTGLFVVLPGPGKAAPATEDYALRLIRRAIGYQVRLSP